MRTLKFPLDKLACVGDFDSATSIHMKIKNSRTGFTLIELLVVISIIAILAALAIPAVTSAITRGQLIQALNNARQIHLATQQMALDRTTTGDTFIGWPADISGADAPELTDAADFAELLIDEGYLEEGDLRIFTAAGIPPATDLENLGTENIAFAVGEVGETSAGNTVFLVTVNYVGGADGLDEEQAPFGNKGWIALRKGGDGSNYRLRQAELDPTETRFEQQVGRLPTGWLVGANETAPPTAGEDD